MLPGMIILWSGAIEHIPCGFHLCDGDLGTPDLRSRFVMGAWESLHPGSHGGSSTHTHDFTSDGHFHTLKAGVHIRPGAAEAYHLPETDVKQCTGETDESDHLPPWYSLCYIMKL